MPSFNSRIVFRNEAPMDMKGAPGTQVILLAAGALAALGGRFIPQFCYLYLRSMSGGALTTSPGLRVGTNAAHNNVAPQFIPATTIVVGQIGAMPLASPMIAPPLDTADLILELTQAAIGPSAMTADILLEGLLVG
jgi:hypothetical protein